MSNFNWKDFLRRHHLFGSLNEMEIEWLLKNEVSEEKEYPQGHDILREGEAGDLSIFLIGSGSVQVVLREQEGHDIILSTLKKGEFFGEMAFFEQSFRSATVVSKENCTLLEIKERGFRKVLDEHHDIESKVLLKLSERLRHANQELLTIKLKDVDEKLSLFNKSIDAELTKIGASVTEVRAMTDHTKSRADDIINSFERTRTWLTWIAGIIVGVITLGGVASGSIVAWYYKRIQNLHTEASAMVVKITSKVDEIETLGRRMKTLEKDVTWSAFRGALKTEEQGDEIKFYEQLKDLSEDEALELTVPMSIIEMAIIKYKWGKDYTEILTFIREEAESAKKPVEVTRAYYLLLTNMILVKGEEFLEGEEFRLILSDLKQYVSEHKERITSEKENLAISLTVSLEEVTEFFEHKSEKRKEKFEQVKKIISGLQS